MYVKYVKLVSITGYPGPVTENVLSSFRNAVQVKAMASIVNWRINVYVLYYDHSPFHHFCLYVLCNAILSNIPYPVACVLCLICRCALCD